MQTSESMREYFSRATPMIPELFGMAHAICANYDLAEYALQCALMEGWVGESRSGVGLRESLRGALKRTALEEALELRAETPETTWDELAEARGDALLDALAQESLETRRAAALRYGCDLSVKRIARLMETTPERVRESLARWERRAGRKLSSAEKRRFDALAAKAIRRSFAQTKNLPSLSSVYRSFAQEAAEFQRPRHLTAKLVHRGLGLLLALLCAVMFWLAAALLHPTVEQPSATEQAMAEFAQKNV